jgi:hypothetical protein
MFGRPKVPGVGEEFDPSAALTLACKQLLSLVEGGRAATAGRVENYWRRGLPFSEHCLPQLRLPSDNRKPRNALLYTETPSECEVPIWTLTEFLRDRSSLAADQAGGPARLLFGTS